ncbi:RNA polymerase sigma-70 factor, ECF subfamily [Pustulibacterium marinum]|uniref:RNA polymerase sigma-70 factor, ECF subfamily n=1 Tax=Pustulibacterium marinum TaxID=1224947 RepID=A0A1I7H4X4_9FLAO|nr:RNA polymerase sigma factor [Pustulibacterium marinum]SFU55757.1 RNA polymerase sigma-70 factor, ECF subfamily [Pustulibacterium marinum]
MNASSFLDTVMPFKDKMFRLAKRLLVSTEEAEDATQEILLKLWKSNERISSYKSVEAFAMTMTKNYCLDRLKSKQAGNLKLVHSNYTDESVSLQRNVENKDSLEWMQRILKTLPEQQRMVLQLRDIEQYDLEEIAEMMEMKNSAVRTSLSRARKAVREALIKTHRYGIQ